MAEAQKINGKEIAAQITENISKLTKSLNAEHGITPGLAVVLVGDDAASQVYVRSKGKSAEKCGFTSVQHTLPANTEEQALLALIEDLNTDDTIHGILVQLPLPDHIDESKVLKLVNPAKDVDGFNPINVGLLHMGQKDQGLVPCTPAGSVILAKMHLGDLSGKHAVVIGRSNIVGKPVAALLLQENCTTTIAHSRTKDLPGLIREADIVIAAVGAPLMVQSDWLKPGATVIDVGINRVDAPEKGEGKTRLVGDVDYPAALSVAGAITPVPGGVGPMTIALLMANTYTAACRMGGITPGDFTEMS